MMKLNISGTAIALAVASLSGTAHAVNFELSEGSIKGSFDSQLTTGFGLRLNNQDCALVGDPGTACVGGGAAQQWTVGDDGNLNYNRGNFFSLYLKGTHELLVALPDRWKAMARGTWLYDTKADQTAYRPLHDDAKKQLARDVRMLDLWVSKEASIGDQTARVRAGNQVLSWGESIFLPGGINAINALDLQRLNIPGTQLKEAVIPAPMVSVASGLGSGVNVEAFYQFGWNANRLAPSGSYFNAGDQFGKGWQNGLVGGGAVPQTGQYEHRPKQNGQFGAALHYRPAGQQVDYGFYAMNYHDKMPSLITATSGALELEYKRNRQLYGVSTNFPLGNWSMGGELSYRPKDAIALAPVGGAGCGSGTAADCHLSTDERRYQMHLTAQLQLTPGDHDFLLGPLGASTAYFTVEGVGIRYPGVNKDKVYSINGVDYKASAGALPFLNGTGTALSDVTGVAGTSTSYGYVVDFNATYDSTLIPGWQVTPGVTMFHAVHGDTPNVYGNFLNGAKSVNVYVLFNMNPAKWQMGLNYTNFFGGDRTRQPLGDRDFIGGFITRNF